MGKGFDPHCCAYNLFLSWHLQLCHIIYTGDTARIVSILHTFDITLNYYCYWVIFTRWFGYCHSVHRDDCIQFCYFHFGYVQSQSSLCIFMHLCSENFMQVTGLLCLLKLMKASLRLLFRARRFLSYDVTFTAVPSVVAGRVYHDWSGCELDKSLSRSTASTESSYFAHQHVYCDHGEQVLWVAGLLCGNFYKVQVSWLRSLLLIKYVIGCVVAFEIGAQCLFIGLCGLDQTCITFAFRLDYDTCCS